MVLWSPLGGLGSGLPGREGSSQFRKALDAPLVITLPTRAKGWAAVLPYSIINNRANKDSGDGDKERKS